MPAGRIRCRDAPSPSVATIFVTRVWNRWAWWGRSFPGISRCSCRPGNWRRPWLPASGIVKIPRLPVMDTTGRPDPKYFKLWKAINENLEPGEGLPGKSKRPKPEVVYREAEGALEQIASQWKERFLQMEAATPGQEHVPPVLILVCDNTDIAEAFYRKISGETEVETVTEADVAEVLGEDDAENGNGNGPKPAKSGKRKTTTVYGKGAIFPEHFSNTPDVNRTIRIDTKLLAEAESDDPKKKRQ